MLVIFINMKGMLNPTLEVGDRIICYHMDGETSVPPGTAGTVTKIHKDPFEPSGDELIISVDWENGSSLSLVSATDAWKRVKEKTIEEQTGDRYYDFYSKNPEIFDNFDWRFFREYLNKVRETGIVNVFSAAPLLYSGEKHIDRYYGENPSNPEKFEELLEMADEARLKMTQGMIKLFESKGKELDLDDVNRQLPRMAQSILKLWMSFY
jgi:hypothetical protein